MPVNIARVFCNSTTGNNNNSTAFFNPANKFVTVIAFIRQNQFSLQIKRFQQSLCKANIITISTGKNKS